SVRSRATEGVPRGRLRVCPRCDRGQSGLHGSIEEEVRRVDVRQVPRVGLPINRRLLGGFAGGRTGRAKVLGLVMVKGLTVLHMKLIKEVAMSGARTLPVLPISESLRKCQ